jgi:hypothetical protein
MWKNAEIREPKCEGIDNSNEDIYPTVSANHFSSIPLPNYVNEDLGADHQDTGEVGQEELYISPEKVIRSKAND